MGIDYLPCTRRSKFRPTLLGSNRPSLRARTPLAGHAVSYYFCYLEENVSLYNGIALATREIVVIVAVDSVDVGSEPPRKAVLARPRYHCKNHHSSYYLLYLSYRFFVVVP